MRTSLRVLFLVISAFAIGLGWYARQIKIHAAEKAALSRLTELCDGSFATIEDGAALSCGTWMGGVAYTRDTGPWPLNLIDSRSFRRVTELGFQDVSNVEIVTLLSVFPKLECVWFNNGSSAFPSTDEAQLAGALKLLSAQRPELQISYDFSQFDSRADIEDYGPFGSENTRSTDSSTSDPFGEGDPFASASGDPFD